MQNSPHMMSMGPAGNHIQACMNLTAAQKQQLAALRQKFIDDTAQLRINLNDKSKDLDILLTTSSPDMKAVKKLIREISDLKASLMEKVVDHQLEVRKIAPELGRGGLFHGGFGRMFDDDGLIGPHGPCWRE